MRKNINHNSNKMLSGSISPELLLQNKAYFLENYRQTKNYNILSSKFKDCLLFVQESQTPDTFNNMENFFDRNSAFYIKNNNQGIAKNLDKRCELGQKLKNKNDPNVRRKINDDRKENMKDDLANKIWSLKVFNESDNLAQFGPYSSKMVYQFLKSFYFPMEMKCQKRINLIILDIINGINYHPKSLYHILQEQL